MNQIQKSIHLTVGQVMIVVANLLVVLTWGLRIENDLGKLMEQSLRTEIQVAEIRTKLEATGIAEAVLSERVERLLRQTTQPVKDD